MSSTVDGPTAADLSAPASASDSLERLLAIKPRSTVVEVAPETEIAGRYVVGPLIGAGGMGEVYRARDLELEREIALKLHRDDAHAARLRREALAMARLAHPNVVTVFEVGDHDGRAFVAMEYVEGSTLRVWLAERTRTRREIIAMLLAAGEGLAAAHDAGLVHRDFKPENVLIGADGRPRVSDFGLARGAVVREDGAAASPILPPGVGPAEAPTLPSDPPGTDGLTAAGTVLGTPAYMAPEQAAGGSVGPAADQYAFAVVAWEALFGARPGAVDSPGTSPKGPRGNSRLRRVLRRALAADPAARFATLRALIAALRRADRAGRQLAIAVGLGVVGLAIAAILMWRENAIATSCDGAGAEIASLPGDLATLIRMRGGAYDRAAAERIETRIEGFRERYRRAAQAVCRAHVIERQWSADLHRRGRACLELRRQIAVRTLTTATGWELSSSDAVQRAVGLPVLASCTDASVLVTQPALPADPERLAAVIAARAALGAATMEQLFELRGPAARLIAEVEASPVATDPLVAPRLRLARSKLLALDGDLAVAEQGMAEAYYAARAADDVEIVLEAVTSLITTIGAVRRDATAVEPWIRNGLADAERMQDRAPDGAAVVYLAAATVADAAGDTERATRLVTLALELLAGASPSYLHASALITRASLHVAASRRQDAVDDYERAIRIGRNLYGPDHPAVARLASATSAGLIQLELTDQARELAQDAMRILALYPEAPNLALAKSELSLGAALLGAADSAAAVPVLESARRRTVAALGAHHPDVALIDTNLGLGYKDLGRLGDAITMLREAAAIQLAILGPDHDELAATHYNLAVALRDHGDLAGALDIAAKAAAGFAVRGPAGDRHRFALTLVAEIANRAGDPARALAASAEVLAMPETEEITSAAWASLERARALLATRGDRAEARTLLIEARARYQRANYAARVAEVDRLLNAAKQKR